jgi:phage gpG-like protein
MQLDIKVDSKAVESKLNRLDSKVENLGPLLDNIADVLITHYKNIMEADPRGSSLTDEYNKAHSEPHTVSDTSMGRAYLFGGMRSSVTVIDMNDSMVSVGPTVSYAERVNAGIPVSPIKTLKADTPGFTQYAWNDGGARDAAINLIENYYSTLME